MSKELSMNRARLFLVSVILSAVAVSCGTLRHVSTDEELDSRYNEYARDHFFMEGIRMYNEHNLDAAMDLMSRSLDDDTASAATCYSLAQYYMSMRDRALVEKYSEKSRDLLLRAVRLEPDNYWSRRLLALNYLRQNRRQEAVEQYEEMSRRFPGRTDILISLAGLYDEAKPEDYNPTDYSIYAYGLGYEIPINKVKYFYERNYFDGNLNHTLIIASKKELEDNNINRVALFLTNGELTSEEENFPELTYGVGEGKIFEIDHRTFDRMGSGE